MTDTATCGDCGAAIEDDRGADPRERRPCPNCGSKKRNYFVSMQATVHLEALATASLSTALPVDFLLQTVIVPGERTPDGLILEAVGVAWFEIINRIAADPDEAFRIPPRMWEEIIAGAYKQAKYDEVILTPRSGDFGRDVIAIKKGLGMVRVIDQVKAFKPGHLVTADDVRALMGVLQTDGASKGFLTTTSDFAPKLREDPLIVPLMPSRLELIDGKTLFEKLKKLAQ